MEVPKIGMASILFARYFTTVTARRLQSLIVDLMWPMVIRALVVSFGTICLHNKCGCGAWGRVREQDSPHELLNTVHAESVSLLCQYMYLT
jgi:hypothetical protein